MSSKFSLVDVELLDGSRAKGLVDVNATIRPRPLPIVVDFRSAKLQHRLKNRADGEAVVKAVGLKASERTGQLVYDFTAGLGTEAFLLAKAGFRVVAFERDPMVFELLRDARKRIQAVEPRLALEFLHFDAVKYFTEPRERAFAVMLDPMFEGEATSGKSMPKKEMASLRKLLTAPSEDELKLLFQTAQGAADARVIVKRPKGAPDLVSTDGLGRRISPSHRLTGKTARFDIYSCR